MLLTAGLAAEAQPAGLEALRGGLLDLGYLEGRNSIIESRWAEGKYDRLPDLATELVRLKVDVLVTAGQTAADAAKRATATIPILAPVVVEPVGTGLAAGLARPAGNVTGSAIFASELDAKRLELLKRAVPRLALTPKRLRVLRRRDGSLRPGAERWQIPTASSAMGRNILDKYRHAAVLVDKMLTRSHFWGGPTR